MSDPNLSVGYILIASAHQTQFINHSLTWPTQRFHRSTILWVLEYHKKSVAFEEIWLFGRIPGKMNKLSKQDASNLITKQKVSIRTCDNCDTN